MLRLPRQALGQILVCSIISACCQKGVVMPVHSVLSEVTSRIIKKSQPYRAAYLEQLEQIQTLQTHFVQDLMMY